MRTSFYLRINFCFSDPSVHVLYPVFCWIVGDFIFDSYRLFADTFLYRPWEQLEIFVLTLSSVFWLVLQVFCFYEVKYIKLFFSGFWDLTNSCFLFGSLYKFIEKSVKRIFSCFFLVLLRFHLFFKNHKNIWSIRNLCWYNKVRAVANKLLQHYTPPLKCHLCLLLFLPLLTIFLPVFGSLSGFFFSIDPSVYIFAYTILF